MNYAEVCIEINPFSEETAELVIAHLSELAFESFLTEGSVLKCYISEKEYSSEAVKALISEFDKAGCVLKSTAKIIEHQNWNALWESNFTPIIVDDRCIIKASFHKDLPDAKYVITIDPKMAFGTGHHQTTRLVIETLLEMDVQNKRVLDMGCGTGILAILAAKMGAAYPLVAIDIDDIAVESAIENSTRNGLEYKINAIEGDASSVKDLTFDLILANINRNIIISDIGIYSNALISGGYLVLSGFYEEDSPLIVNEGEKFGLTPVFSKSLDNWTVIKMIKK
ncbi:MAG: 50S ribosomal protein L11 methyltransferase [Bacteroidetes bacterium HGW-Bacteroidetes-7]|jgi:ribosomal protein L11 methyltransferase|nr:MAG: 50S ribosomal protein L11 methyltransferase [Bacteroidetes bacterium HGW-Bacteroidetes-7]